jgi:hypothetical protein
MPIIIPGNRQASTAYTIDQSIRFNDADNPYMGRTPSATGTEETWTWSFWVKRATLGTLQVLFQIGADKNNCDQFYFNTDDQLQYQHLDSGSNTDDLETTQVFRDASAWYHIILVADTTNAVESERIRIYVNGERVTNFATENYPTQNTPTDVNTQVLHQIGAQLSATYYSFDGYMAEIHFLDGYAYDPSFFGEFNSSGIWIPKEYTGSYGSNGFKIDGRDASDLGDDESGNGNDFTASGLAAHDQVLDTPTNNFCVLTPLATLMNSGSTLSNGNLKIVLSGNDQFHSNFEISEKSYCEVRLDASSNYGGALGFGTFQGLDDDDNTIAFSMNYLSGRINLGNGSSGGDVGGNVSVGDIIMMALDPDTRKWWVGVNGTWRNSGDPAGGTGHVYQYATDYFDTSSSYSTTDGIGAIVWGGFKGSANGMTVTWNFGQEGTFGGQETAGGNADGNGNGNFKYTVPSGFKALCSKSMGS